MYTTNFRLRAKNSAGTVQKTFQPAPGIGRNVSVERGEGVWIEREKLDFSTDNYFIGWKQRVEAVFVDVNKYISGDSGYDTLEAVLNALPAGGSLEYSVDGGSTWVPCEIDEPEREKLDDKNQAVRMLISCLSKAVVSSPFKVT